MKRYLLLFLLLLTISPTYAHAEQIRVAVASNFTQAIKDLAQAFEEETGHDVQLIYGSTGKIYAQIQHGAPFDLFFAADTERPSRLEQEKRIQTGSRFTYARGKLALWSKNPSLVDANGEVLNQGNFRHLAIANPKLAPYGLAAKQTLQSMKLWDDMQDKLVQGENIGQTLQFVRTENAELGFVALSQLIQPDQPQLGSLWEVPAELYDPIDQQAVQLTDNAVATAFLDFVKSPQGHKLIRQYGYDIP
jgi:molybdate transport system substrate-binding protein